MEEWSALSRGQPDHTSKARAVLTTTATPSGAHETSVGLSAGRPEQVLRAMSECDRVPGAEHEHIGIQFVHDVPLVGHDERGHVQLLATAQDRRTRRLTHLDV